MAATKKRLITGLILICLCLSFCALTPVQASADGEISKVLVTLSREPVVMDGVYSATAATSTEGCTIVSYGWYDSFSLLPHGAAECLLCDQQCFPACFAGYGFFRAPWGAREGAS